MFSEVGQMTSIFAKHFILSVSSFIYLSLHSAFTELSLRSRFKNTHQQVQRVNFHFEISCQRVLCGLFTIHYSSSMDDKF